MIGRSHSSVKDQVLYSQQRLEDLKSLKPVKTEGGIEYKAIQRLGIGMCSVKASQTHYGHWDIHVSTCM